jgi:hypothetical protein
MNTFASFCEMHFAGEVRRSSESRFARVCKRGQFRVGATTKVVGEWRGGERGTGNQGWGPGLSSCFAVIAICVRASVRQENLNMVGGAGLDVGTGYRWDIG